jgi:hypothetical protein
MRLTRGLVFGLLAGLLAVLPAAAQDDQTVTVPSVLGLNVPQAAAALNAAGLRFGGEIQVDAAAGGDNAAPNLVSAQSVTAGEVVPFGAAVEVTVPRAANAVLVYDDNDITLINETGGVLGLGSLTFNAIGSSSPISYTGTRWPSGALDTDDCAQLWSVGRNGPKDVDGCPGSMFWLTTNNTGEHFWTGAGGATQFEVLQEGVQRAVCPVSATGRCTFFLSGGTSDETTAYIYLAYTRDKFIVFNQSPDRWMPIASLNIVDANGGINPIGNPVSYGNPDIIGSIERLAPGQCLYVRNNAEGPPPQACNVIYELAVNVDFVLWYSDFIVSSVTDGRQRTCPAAQEGRLTLCIVPR